MKEIFVAMLFSLGFSLSLFSAEIAITDKEGHEFKPNTFLELNLFKKMRSDVLKVKALFKNFEVQEYRSNGLGYEGDTGCMGDIESTDSIFDKSVGYELTREEVDRYCGLHIFLVPRTKELTWVITHQGEIEQKLALEFEIIEVLDGNREIYERFKAAEQTNQETDKNDLKYLQENLNEKLKSLQVGAGKVSFWAFKREKNGAFILKNGKVLDI